MTPRRVDVARLAAGLLGTLVLVAIIWLALTLLGLVLLALWAVLT